MKIKFSTHAYRRVDGRLSMTHDELKILLTYDLFVVIGTETANNRVHKLFYSAKDAQCFVAIQDKKDGTVVTVLPIDYHNNICWIVSLHSQNLAKRLIIGTEKLVTHTSQDESPYHLQDDMSTSAQKPKHKRIQTSRFQVSLVIANMYNNSYMKNVNIGTWDALYYNKNIEDFAQCPQFVNELRLLMENKKDKLDVEDGYLRSLIVKLGKKGEPYIFTVADIVKPYT